MTCDALSTNCDELKFADDTATLCHAKIEANLQLIAEDTLNKTEQYMKQNRLTLHEEKTEVIEFRKEKLPTLKLSISRDFNWKHLKNVDI